MPGDTYDMEPMPELPHADGRVVDEDVRCVTCDALLTGRPAGGACECGTTIAFSRFGPDVKNTDGSGPVVGTLFCRRCGYDLSGLSATGVCPECAMSVRRSLMGDPLSSSDPAYVAALARGALIAEWTVILYVLLRVSRVYVASTLAGAALGDALGLVMVGLNVASLAGWWMLTTRDPALGVLDPGGRARRVLRVALVLMIVFTALEETLGRTATQVGSGGILVLAMLTLAAPVVWLVKIYASFSYLTTLDARLPGGALAHRVASARTTLNWSLGILVVSVVLSYVAPCVALLPFIGLLICALVFLMRYVTMLETARSALKAARAEALAI